MLLKRLLDVTGSLCLLLPAALLVIPFAVLLLIKKRRAFRWETRSGQFGAAFEMLRLNVDRPVRSNSGFESLLEYLSITELPQLWNVLRGQMSLVGPRPDPISSLGRYSEWQQRRLKVKPGITGLAQVRGFRGETLTSESLEGRLTADLEYIDNWSLIGDIRLLVATLKVPLDRRAY